VVLIAEATSRESNLKKTAQRLLVERIRRQGFDNSARVLSQWMDAVQQTGGDVSQYGSAYLSFLHACEKGRPLKSRQHFLKKGHEEEPIVAVQLAAALALDDPEQGFFLPILRELIVEDVDDVSIDQLRTKSLGALFLSHQALIPLFGDRSLRSLPEFSDDDLKWAVLRLARYDSMLLVEFSKELIRRRLVPSYSGVFLESLVKSPPSSLSNAVRGSLVKAALGAVTEEEVGHLSRWVAPESEAVLLALCATAPNETAAVEAFDVLSARSLENEPAASLVDWVKSRYWDYRKRLVKAVGIVSLSDRADEGDLAYAFQAFLPFAKGGSLFRLFIESGSPKLIAHSIKAFAAITPVEILLPLLQHGDRGVRLAVVLELKDRNGLGVLQAILRAYEKEGDPEVCRAYHDNHWVTRRPSKSVCNEFLTKQSGE